VSRGLPDRLNGEAVDFIKRNRERPFSLAHYAPHSTNSVFASLVIKPVQQNRTTRYVAVECERRTHLGRLMNSLSNGEHVGQNGATLPIMASEMLSASALITEQLDLRVVKQQHGAGQLRRRS